MIDRSVTDRSTDPFVWGRFVEVDIKANDLLVFSTAVHAGGGLEVDANAWDHVFHANFDRYGTFSTGNAEHFFVTPKNAISEEHVLKFVAPPAAHLKNWDCQHFVEAARIEVARAYVWGVLPCNGPCEFSRAGVCVERRIQACLRR